MPMSMLGDAIIDNPPVPRPVRPNFNVRELASNTVFFRSKARVMNNGSTILPCDVTCMLH